MPRQYTPRVGLLCAHCGGGFEVPAHQASVIRFCSTACRRAHPRKVTPIEERLWPRVIKTDSCWEWSGARSGPNGYGVIGVRRRVKLTHIVAWELGTGQVVPNGLKVLHACDNPPCVRNDEPGVYILRGVEHPRLGHLWLGTIRDNARDMADKGRSPKGGESGDQHWSHTKPASRMYGERNPRAVFAEPQIRDIRAAVAHGETMTSLAKQHGVSIQAIWSVVNRKTWKHVP